MRRVWEVDDNLQEAVIYSELKQMQELLCQTHAKVGGILHIPFPIQKRVTMLAASGQKNYLLIHTRYRATKAADFSDDVSTTQVRNILSGSLI